MRNRRIHLNINEINLLLLTTSALSCGLVMVRIVMSQSPLYASLIWNLFLAWIPYIISYKVQQKHHLIRRSYQLYLLFGFWIIFYPNAPYIITDLFHLNERAGAPQWFDLVLIFSFAMNGAILGLISLKDMQMVVNEKTNDKKAWWFAISVLILSGFGVYLGRYLRWNSWDVVSQTVEITKSLWQIVRYPTQNARAYGFTLLFGIFQIIMYVSFRQLIDIMRKNELKLKPQVNGNKPL